MNDLHFAAYCGDADEVLMALASGCDVNSQDDRGYTPLHWVVDMGMTAGDRTTVVTCLIEHGAVVDSRDAKAATPLIVACFAGNDGLVAHLVHAGADVNARTVDGDTPLFAAVTSGNERSVDLLLDHGVDVNTRAPDGTSAMDRALRAEQDHIVRVLRSHGAA